MKQELLKVSADLLDPNPWNSNIVSAENQQKLENSIDELGNFKPILVRELNGRYEILGGEHRWMAAKKKGIEALILNIGAIDDVKAKKISLADNARYGYDDSLMLSEVLKSLGEPVDILSILPYSDKQLEILIGSTQVNLEDLVFDEEEAEAPKDEPLYTKSHTIVRFKIPVEDALKIEELLKNVCKAQGFKDGDSLTNLGDALVFICNTYMNDAV